MEIDKYLEDVVSKGYVYFIYSDVINRIYIGESEGIKRIEIYQSIIDEKDSYNRIKMFHYYSKIINQTLLEDLVNYKNNFKIIKMKTKYHKHLERSYIRYFYDNGYKLYNRKLYKNHQYDEIEIDENIILTIEETLKK